MVAYATWDDVVESYEFTLPPARQAWVETQLRRGSARLRQLVPTLDTRLALPATDPAWVDPEIPNGLLVDAVLRVVRNPTGALQQSAGPFNQQLPQGQRAEIVFDEEEVQQLLAPPATALGGSIRLAIPLPHRRSIDDPNWLPRA